jgi:hypothetical protein
MNRILIMSVLLLFLNACTNGQNKEKDKIEDNKKAVSDSLHTPKTNIKVNKEYDDDGNLIRYDSTYTSFYSNIEGDKAKADSIFNKFKLDFNFHYPFSKKPYFDNLFFTDSLLKYDFYKKDFFDKRFHMNMKHMEDMFKEMDSIKNKYYKSLDSL